MKFLARILVAYTLLVCGLGAPAFAQSPEVPVLAQPDPCPGATLCGDFTKSAFKGFGAITSRFASLPNLTVTRASGAYAENPDGSLVWFQSGQARATAKGLGVFEATTNLILQSGTVGNGSWSSAGSASAALNTDAAPDGTLTASRITTTSFPAGYFATTSSTLTAGTTYITSGYFRLISGGPLLRLVAAGQSSYGGSGGDRYVTFNASSCSSGTTSGVDIQGFTLTSAAGGWCRVTVKFTPTSTASSAMALYSDTATSVFDAWGADLRAGAYPVPYCPTAASTATCAADNVAISGTTLPNAYTWEVSGIYTKGGAGTFPTLISSTNNSGLGVGVDDGRAFANMGSSGFNSFISSPYYTNGTIVRAAFVAATNAAVTSSGGVTGASSGTFTPATGASPLYLGSLTGTTAYWNGYLTGFAVVPSALSQGQINAYTSGTDTSSLSLNFAAGLYKTTTPYVRTNYVLNSEAPATQTVTLATGSYALSVVGSGSVTPSAGTATITGASAATAGAWNVFTVTGAGTVTITVSGSLTRFQLNNGHYPSSYVPTTTLAASTATFQSVNPADIGDLSFTGGPGYATDCNGNLVSFAANVPRITCAGVLIEEARTNSFLWSTDLTNAAWNKSNVIVTGGQTGPDGSATAAKVIPASGASGLFYQNVPATSGTTYVHAWYLKSAGLTSVRLQVNDGALSVFTDINLSTCAASATSGGGSSSATTTFLANGWCRASLVYTAANTTTASYFAFDASNGDGTNGYYVWNPDLQAGAFIASPILTTSATVTRPADVMSYTLTVPAPATVAACANVPSLPTTSIAVLVGGASGLPNFSLGTGAALAAQASARNIVGLGSTGNLYTPGQTSCVALRYQSGSSGLSLAGGTVVTSANTFTPTATGVVGIGYDAFNTTNWLNGALKNVAIFSYAANDNELPYRSAGNF